MVTLLSISGMLSVHAKRAVFTALGGVPGVRSAEVELGHAVVEHDGSTSTEALAAAIAAVGCRVTSHRPRSERPLPVLSSSETSDGQQA